MNALKYLPDHIVLKDMQQNISVGETGYFFVCGIIIIFYYIVIMLLAAK